MHLRTCVQRPSDPRDPRASSLLQAWDGHSALTRRAVLLGLPYDGGIPSRPGARFGPGALRAALGAFGTAAGDVELADATPALDLGDLTLPTTDGAVAHRQMQAAAREVWAAGAHPVFLGGDHGCTGSVLRGLADARPDLRLALITIDAHLDVREYENEAALSSGTPFRRALETPVITGARVAMLGLRRFANSRFYLNWVREQGVHLYSVEDVAEQGPGTVAEQALAATTADADALYLSVDLDAADAAVAPGVSATGVGGLAAREMIALVRTIAAHPKWIGGDIMELSPPYDQDGRTAKLGARLLLEMLVARAAG